MSAATAADELVRRLAWMDEGYAYLTERLDVLDDEWLGEPSGSRVGRAGT